MNEQDLIEALEPVRHYFRGATVSPNTVLAAYLRSNGLQPSGDAWQLAKAGLQAGMSFDVAVDLALSQVSMGKATSVAVPKEVGAALLAAEVKAEALEEDAEETYTDQQSASLGTAPNGLSWYAKPMGMGDLHGEGAAKLLGQPNIPLAAMLVRETAQNSWDARLRNHPVDFIINVRRLSPATVQTLADSIFIGDANGLGVREALAAEQVWAIEISDRGTRGLDGPIRNDRAVPEGIATNFIDLIFNVGAPRDVHMGAGTYGFGKTVTYLTSSCHTVLFWSRTMHRGALQDRLIGSAIGPSFDADGRRYTGRHWWGLSSVEGEGDRVEPLIGEPACALGEKVFERHFREGETGTSLMILAPDLHEEGGYEEWAKALSEAATWHLWPKMVPRDGATLPMRIEVQLNGVPVSVPDIDRHPVLRGYADGLRAVRAAQEGTEYTAKYHTLVKQVWSHKPQTLLGHLALTMYPEAAFSLGEESEIAPVHTPSHHIALMRHEAELVVKYDAKPPLNFEGLQWAGVFKPVAEVDDSFAAAEPPAHDDWAYAAVEDRSMKSHVRVAQTRLREMVIEFLKPSTSAGKDVHPQHPTAALADALADLIPTVEGPRPTGQRLPGKGGGAGVKRPQVSILEHRLGALVEGRRRMAVRVEVFDPAGGAVVVEPDVGIAVDGGRDAADDAVKLLGWMDEPSESSVEQQFGSRQISLAHGATAWFAVDIQPDLALDVRFKPVVVDS